jgi:acyl transferase domain-containing protein
MVGHSLGEIAAACAASAVTLEDAVELVEARGRLIQALPGGSMLSVRAEADWVREHLPEGVSLASENAPGLVAVSGPADRIEALEEAWAAEGVRCTRLHTSHAFHSSMMDAAMDPFREVVKRLRFFPPEVPVMSTVTGSWLTPDEAMDPEYWVRHIRSTVRFQPAVEALASEGFRTFLEVGPRTTATTLVDQCLGEKALCVPSLEVGPRGEAEDEALLAAAGRLWLAGVELDWAAMTADGPVRRIDLPTYPFEGERCWIEPPDAGPDATAGVERRPRRSTGPAEAGSGNGVAADAALPDGFDGTNGAERAVILGQLGVIRNQLALLQELGLPGGWRSPGSRDGGTDVAAVERHASNEP